tara:strand:- start:12 stop:518 length:507 start_codon:yes stop_codon:yes gene_type:complete
MALVQLKNFLVSSSQWMRSRKPKEYLSEPDIGQENFEIHYKHRKSTKNALKNIKNVFIVILVLYLIYKTNDLFTINKMSNKKINNSKNRNWCKNQKYTQITDNYVKKIANENKDRDCIYVKEKCIVIVIINPHDKKHIANHINSNVTGIAIGNFNSKLLRIIIYLFIY